MTQVRSEFCERRQHKSSQVKPWVGNDQTLGARLPENLIAIEQEIKVKRSRTATILKVAPETALGLQQDRQELMNWQLRFYPRHEVEKCPADVTDRLGFVRGRISGQRASRKHA